MKESKYDFFISHASEDKDSFVRPLAQELIDRGYNVWYDEFSLKVGDSLIQSISDGIQNSLYGILVLSKNFFVKKWTKKELEVLLHKEIITDNNLILPIWLNIDKDDVYKFSPFLIDKLGITANFNNIVHVINSIEDKVSIKTITINEVRGIIEHLCICNQDRRNKYFFDLEKRVTSIYLYMQEYENWCNDNDELLDTNEGQLQMSFKEKEFRNEYQIPHGVWLNHESLSDFIEIIIKLCKNWIYRKMDYYRYYELFFLIENHLDADLPYILYGFPNSTIRSEETNYECTKGILEVGIKNPKLRFPEKNIKNEIETKVFDKYYGG